MVRADVKTTGVVFLDAVDPCCREVIGLYFQVCQQWTGELLMYKGRWNRHVTRGKSVREMEIDRARKMPIFTSEATDSLRQTDYMFLTSGPADIILSLVAATDFSSLPSSSFVSFSFPSLAFSFLFQIRWEKNITLGEPPGFLHSWWW